MGIGPNVMGMPLGDAQPLEQIVRLIVSGPAANPPRLAPGAGWVGHLQSALTRTEIDPGDLSAVIILIIAVYPGGEDPDTPPDSSDSDYDPELKKYIIDELGDSPWCDLITGVEIREEWQPDAELHLQIHVYARRRPQEDDEAEDDEAADDQGAEE